jgi:hypothetical protein
VYQKSDDLGGQRLKRRCEGEMSVVESEDQDGGRHVLIWAAIAKKQPLSYTDRRQL